MSDETIEHQWLEPPNWAATDFERMTVTAINKLTDAVSVSHELAFRNLRELHSIRMILMWTLIVIPGMLVVLMIVLNTIGHQSPTVP